VVAWTILFLALADLGVGRLFRPPADQRAHPSTLQRYFDYGRSVEGKLRRMVKPEDDRSAPIVLTGWLRGPDIEQQPRHPSAPGHLFVAAYGQSFLADVLASAREIDPALEWRILGGPAAPLNHLYKRYQLDRQVHQAKVVVLGVLASSVAELATLTPMTSGFEGPTPYTYPRYRLDGAGISEVPAPLEDLPALRRALAKRDAWSSFRASLAASDSAFFPAVFDADLFDASTIGRLVRRALGHRHQISFEARYHDQSGFTNADHLVEVGRALLADFGNTAHADGRIPLVVLFDDRGYTGQLEAAFASTLEAAHISYVSSHTVAPASNLANFVADGHFTPQVDHQLGRMLLDRIRSVSAAQ
jgi:hypothetical protein